MKIKILLADDQILFVESLNSVFTSRVHDLKIVGIAHNGREAIDMTEKLVPDIILMDVRMPEIDGVQATKIIHNSYPEIKIVMLSTHDDDRYVKQAIKNGAVGYLLKDVPPRELFNAVRAVNEGTFLLPPSMASRLILSDSTSVYHAAASEADLPEWYYVLSRKERHILRLVVEGYDNLEISEQVHLAGQTVKNYLSRIYDKIDAHGRLEAIKKARSFLNYLFYF